MPLDLFLRAFLFDFFIGGAIGGAILLTLKSI